MARPLRIEFAGALYHVMSRGNERRAIVRDDVDRRKRLDWLRRTVETYGWRLHAFVLLNNHEHLFVETPEPNLSAGMQYLNGSYTSYFNRRHHRAGHLFQGRFKGHLIEEDGHFREISRYIHLNPVRARLVARPQQWPWGSYRGYCRASAAVEWITYERVLGEYGSDGAEARRSYARFVLAAIAQPPPSPFAGAVAGLLVGCEAFVTRVRRLLKDRPADDALPQLGQLGPRPTLEQIAATVRESLGCAAGWSAGHRSDDAGRAVAAYLARRRFGYSATAVAAALGYHGPSSVSHAVARVESGGASVQATVRQLEKEVRYSLFKL